MNDNANKSAYPVPEYAREWGLTKREYFAAHAPITLNDAYIECMDNQMTDNRLNISRSDALDMLASLRSNYADLQLEELEKTSK